MSGPVTKRGLPVATVAVDAGVAPQVDHTTISDRRVLRYQQSTGKFIFRDPNWWDPKDFGVKCDGVLTHGSITTGTAAFTATVSGAIPAATFQTTDVGKLISIPGAGAAGADLVTTIAAVPSPGTHGCTLTANAGTTVTGALVYYASDDLAAINTMLSTVIPLGGRIQFPWGVYVGLSGTVDFGAMGTVAASQFRPLTFSGQGGSVNDSIGQASTIFLNFGTGIALKSWAANVMGLHFADFTVVNVTDIGQGVFTIDWSNVAASASMRNVRVFGRGNGAGSIGTRPNVGNGIRVDNPQVGQVTLENVVADRFDSPASGGFKGSEGFRFGAENPAANGNTGVNSGNIVATALKSTCTVAYRWKDGALFNGGTFNSLKAVMNSGGGNIAYWFENSNQAQHVLNAPHSEGYHTAYWLNGCQGVKVNAPLASLPAGSTGGDGSVAFLFDNNGASLASGNEVSAASISGASGFDVGVKFTGGAIGNGWTGRFLPGFAPNTAKFSLNGLNSYWDMSTVPQQIISGGSPEGAVTAPVGTVYQRPDGAGGTTLWVKESGSGNTGWSVKQDKDNGQPGMLAPDTRMPKSWSNLLMAASQAYFARLIPSRLLNVTLIAFSVSTAATNNDNIDVGIFTVSGGNLVKVASSGSTAGKVNSTGIQTIALAATLTAGTTYYIGICYGTVGGTAATLQGLSFNSSQNTLIFGNTLGKVDACILAAAFPLGTNFTPTLGSNNACPLLAVRES